MRISLSKIKDFSQCPRYFSLKKTVPSISLQIAVFEFILKRCHMQATETGHRTGWRTIVGWVDSRVFSNVDIENEESYEAAKKNSEHILIALQKWYGQYYLEESYESYVDIDLDESAGDHYVFGRLPIIQVADIPIVTLVQDTSMNSLEVYNDIVIRGLMYLAIRILGCESVQLRLIELGSRGGLEVTEQLFDSEVGSRAWLAVREIARLIGQGVNYPSRSNQCKSCSFFRRCKL